MKILVNFLLIFLLIDQQLRVFCGITDHVDYRIGVREEGDMVYRKSFIQGKPGEESSIWVSLYKVNNQTNANIIINLNRFFSFVRVLFVRH